MIKNKRFFFSLMCLAAMLVVFTALMGCSDDDLDSSGSAALDGVSDGGNTGDSNSSDAGNPDDGVECSDIDDTLECEMAVECYYRPNDEVCMARDGSDGPLCIEKEYCSGSEAIDACSSDENCCAIAMGIVDLDAATASDAPCSEYSTYESVCFPEEVTVGDNWISDKFVTLGDDGEPKLLLQNRLIGGAYEDAGFYRCSDLPETISADLADACDSCSLY